MSTMLYIILAVVVIVTLQWVIRTLLGFNNIFKDFRLDDSDDIG